MIGDQYKEERREKIKNMKLIAMQPNSHPITRFMLMSYDLGRYFDT